MSLSDNFLIKLNETNNNMDELIYKISNRIKELGYNPDTHFPEFKKITNLLKIRTK